MTGFSSKVRASITERDGGCALWSERDPCFGGHQIHHRCPRGTGGSKAPWVNQPSNGLLLCAKHHQWAELNRSTAQNLGVIVRHGIRLPSEIPVQHARFGVVFLLDEAPWTSHEPPTT